jgi:hypothetical protein
MPSIPIHDEISLLGTPTCSIFAVAISYTGNDSDICMVYKRRIELLEFSKVILERSDC